MTKAVRGDPRVARALLDGGVDGLADSRLENLRRLRDGVDPGQVLLLRAPPPGRGWEAVTLADGVLCTSPELGRELAAAAARLRPGRPWWVILPVDLGDLREGVLPEELPRAAVGLERELARASGRRDPDRRAHVAGLAANMACLAGVVPTRAHLEELVALARETGRVLGRSLSVSGGNTAVLPLLLGEGVPPGLDDLRVGEGILLGRDSLERRPLPGCHVDAFRFVATILEVGKKPSAPVGRKAEDAFGGHPVFVDRGRRRRAVLAAGRQDCVPDGLSPLAEGVEVVGASSDHLVVDVEEYPGPIGPGTELGFSVGYACLLQAMTSADVAKVYVGES